MVYSQIPGIVHVEEPAQPLPKKEVLSVWLDGCYVF